MLLWTFYSSPALLSRLTVDAGILHAEQMDTLLNQLFPTQKKGKTTRIRIMEASAIAFYHQETGTDVPEYDSDIPVVTP